MSCQCSRKGPRGGGRIVAAAASSAVRRVLRVGRAGVVLARGGRARGRRSAMFRSLRPLVVRGQWAGGF